MDDNEAIELLRQGNINGLEALVLRYQVQAMRAAYLVTHDEALAEDIVATAFLRVYERIHQFEANRRFRPWFLRIVVNDALNAVIRRDRQDSLEDEEQSRGTSPGRVLPDRKPGPEDLAERSETDRAVREALKALPPQQRAAIVMRYFLELRVTEIAERMGRSPGTVKRHLHNGRLRLRTLLAGLIGNDDGPK